MNVESLINQIRQCTQGMQLPPPATPEELAKVEELIGFELPPLLRAIYSEIGNGGVAGFMPLFSKRPRMHRTDGAIGLYLLSREADLDAELDLVEEDSDGWNGQYDDSWPAQLIPICDEGCAIRTCVDCSNPKLPVFRDDPNSGRRSRVSPSLEHWLEKWIEGMRAQGTQGRQG